MKLRLNLNFYQQIKLINFMRRQVPENVHGIYFSGCAYSLSVSVWLKDFVPPFRYIWGAAMAVGRSSQTRECWWNTCIACSTWTGFLSPLFGTNHSMFSVNKNIHLIVGLHLIQNSWNLIWFLHENMVEEMNRQLSWRLMISFFLINCWIDDYE